MQLRTSKPGRRRDLLKQSGPKCCSWLRNFFSTCLSYLQIPIKNFGARQQWLHCPSPKNQLADLKSYLPISLLCIHTTAWAPPPASSQANCWPSTTRTPSFFDTVAWLFNRWLINRRHWSLFRGQGESWSGADLTAAYNSVRHQGLSLELLCIIPDRQMAQFIVNILSNCSFKVKTRNGKCSHLWCLQNGLPQGSLLAPLLFTIYISEILSTRSCQYRYADDLALLYTNKSREELEKTLSTDMCVIAEDPACYRKLSVTKTTSTTFHLNIKETKCQLAVNVWGNTLPYNSNHSLWVKLDRQLTYKSRAYVRE